MSEWCAQKKFWKKKFLKGCAQLCFGLQKKQLQNRHVKEGNEISLHFAERSIKLPESRGRKLIEGGYVGKEVILGIRPEDIKDEEVFIKTSMDSAFDATVRVYELLGAEVFLYFTIADNVDITARVNPRTTARPGDTIKIAMDLSKIHIFDKETEKVITH